MSITLPIKDITSLSELVAKSVMIESYIESKLFLAKISKDASKSVILEADDQKQKTKDADILDTSKNLAAAIQNSGLATAASFASSIESALSQYESMIGKEGFNRSPEQTQMNNTARALVEFNNGLAKAIVSVANARNSKRPPSADVIKAMLSNKYLANIKGIQLDTEAVTNEVINADQKTLEGISSKIRPSQIPENPPEAAENNNEGTADKETLKKAMEDEGFKSSFSGYTSSKGFEISMDGFKAMVKQKLIDDAVGQKFIEDFINGEGKDAFEKVKASMSS